MANSMKWNPNPLVAITGITLASAPIYVHAKIYVSTEQAQKLIFPNKQLTTYPVVLTEDIQDKMQSASSVRHPFKGDRTWKAADGSFFIVDEVVGKHEMITYAIGITPNGTIQSIEVMEYVESYGYEVAEQSWRNQFIGKTAEDPLKLKQDIQNISGATLSCKHLTDGVKRLMVMYDLALKPKSK
jgi:Na+-translocating ferredoxin:NAD+ oxidoreductase RnfG subunit